MTADQWKRFQISKTTNTARNPSSQSHDASTLDDADARISNLSEIIRKWESNFGRHMKILSDSLNHYAATETVVLLSLCARLSTVNQGTEWAAMGADEEEVA